MATLSVTVPDAALPRIRAAFGHAESLLDPTWVPATAAEIQAWMRQQLKQRVIDYEGGIAADAARAGVSSDVGTW